MNQNKFILSSMKFRKALRDKYGPTPVVIVRHGPFALIVEKSTK